MAENHSDFLKINNFLANSVLKNSPLRTNRFIGVLDTGKLNIDSKTLAWNIYKVNCPNLFLDIDSREIDMQPKIYFKNWVYNDLEVSYLEDSSLTIRKLFFAWMNKIVSSETFRRAYYDDIKADYFKIMPINNKGQSDSYEVFYDVTPFEINSIDFEMDGSGDNTVLTTVKFKYIGHEVKSLNKK